MTIRNGGERDTINKALKNLNNHYLLLNTNGIRIGLEGYP